MLTLALVLLGAALVLFLIHRIALWMESHGWIYWTRSSGASTRAGNAMLEVQKILEPPKSHILELKRDTKPARDDQGDVPGPL
jgi:hypothetical protein